MISVTPLRPALGEAILYQNHINKLVWTKTETSSSLADEFSVTLKFSQHSLNHGLYLVDRRYRRIWPFPGNKYSGISQCSLPLAHERNVHENSRLRASRNGRQTTGLFRINRLILSCVWNSIYQFSCTGVYLFQAKVADAFERNRGHHRPGLAEKPITVSRVSQFHRPSYYFYICTKVRCTTGTRTRKKCSLRRKR